MHGKDRYKIDVKMKRPVFRAYTHSKSDKDANINLNIVECNSC